MTGRFALTAGVMSGDLSEWNKALYGEIFSISESTVHDSCPQEWGSWNSSYMMHLGPKPRILRLPCPNTCTAEPSGCLEELSSARGDWLWFQVFSYLTLWGEERMGQTQHCTQNTILHLSHCCWPKNIDPQGLKLNPNLVLQKTSWNFNAIPDIKIHFAAEVPIYYYYENI